MFLHLLPVLMVHLVRADTILGTVSKLKEKVATNGYSPKGLAFNTIKGPKRFDSKIGIVGGGPAGIHMAYQLYQRGYTNVTILEKSPELGGKAETFFYRQSEIPLSVLLWGLDYQHTLIPLLKKYGILTKDNNFCPLPQLHIWPLNNDSKEPKEAFKQTKEQAEKVLYALDAYIDLHHELFGIYNNDFGLMPRPNERTLAKIGQGSFHDFLQANGLLALEFVTKLILTASGYGTLKEIPAIYGLIWATPTILFDAVTMRGGVRTLKFRSIAEIFPKIVQEENLNVRYNFDVVKVRKGQRLNYK